MSVEVKRRRDTAANLAGFVGAQAELLVDTTHNRIQVHDGATPGGWPAAKLAEVVTNARTEIADADYSALASDRTVAYTKQPAGRLRRITVAVLIDNLRSVGKDGKPKETPLAKEQLDHINQLVKDAVGYDEQRGDSVNVVNASFTQDTTPVAERACSRTAGLPWSVPWRRLSPPRSPR